MSCTLRLCEPQVNPAYGTAGRPGCRSSKRRNWRPVESMGGECSTGISACTSVARLAPVAELGEGSRVPVLRRRLVVDGRGGRRDIVARGDAAGHRRHLRVGAVALPGRAVPVRPAGGQRLPDHRVGRRAVLPRGPRHPARVPATPGWRRTRPRSSSCSTSPTPRCCAGWPRSQRPAAAGARLRAPRQALGARRRHPGGAGRARRAGRLRHPLAARPARRRADAVRRPDGRRRRHPAERLPAHAPASGGGSPTGWSTCATTTTCRRWAAAGAVACLSGPHRGVPALGGRCRCWSTWRTSSSSAGAASPATTAG